MKHHRMTPETVAPLLNEDVARRIIGRIFDDPALTDEGKQALDRLNKQLGGVSDMDQALQRLRDQEGGG